MIKFLRISCGQKVGLVGCYKNIHFITITNSNLKNLLMVHWLNRIRPQKAMILSFCAMTKIHFLHCPKRIIAPFFSIAFCLGPPTTLPFVQVWRKFWHLKNWKDCAAKQFLLSCFGTSSSIALGKAKNTTKKMVCRAKICISNLIWSLTYLGH